MNPVLFPDFLEIVGTSIESEGNHEYKLGTETSISTKFDSSIYESGAAATPLDGGSATTRL